MLKKDWNYRRGDIYLVDLGEHRGNIQGGVRPVINIQNNSGNFFGPTLIVVPLTTELKKLGQPTHYVMQYSLFYHLPQQILFRDLDENMFRFSVRLRLIFALKTAKNGVR